MVESVTQRYRCVSMAERVPSAHASCSPARRNKAMPGLKHAALAVAATATLLLPITPAAAGPWIFAPWALGHVIGAAARLATLPLAIASATTYPQQPAAPYAAGPGYYGAPGGYGPPNYYARPPAYYPQPPGYYPAPQAYYGPALAYAPPMQRFYAQPRGYYAAPGRYLGSYGAQFMHRSGGFTYRRH
jgi:hypothetical protein